MIICKIIYLFTGNIKKSYINIYLHSNVLSNVNDINNNNNNSNNNEYPQNITINNSVSSEPCDEIDRANKRSIRNFNKSMVGKCLDPYYHTQYYDDIVNTFIAAINILYSINNYNITFVIIQGTLLSILRNQPILPWDSDADIYLVNNIKSKTDNNNYVDGIQTTIATDNNNDIDIDDDDYNWNIFGKYDEYNGYDLFEFEMDNSIEDLFEIIENATNNYISNSADPDKKLQYSVKFDRNDAVNIFRFLKKEATNWGCTGYTDIYVIDIDNDNDLYYGGDAGEIAHTSVDVNLLFPVKQFKYLNWFPHWKKHLNLWNGEMFNQDTIPIPNKKHKWAELAYTNHMISDKNDSLTCEIPYK